MQPTPRIVGQISQVLGGKVPETLVAQAIADQDSVLGTFLALLAREERAQAAERDKNKPNGATVTATACK